MVAVSQRVHAARTGPAVPGNAANQWDGLLLTPAFRRLCATMEVQTDHSGDEEKSEMKISRAGVDIAKLVFHVHAVGRDGRVQWRGKLKRN